MMLTRTSGCKLEQGCRRHTGLRTRLFVLAGCITAMTGLGAAARAQQNFHVRLNTAPLIGSSNGLFSLDFQLSDGSGTNDANNTAKISNLNFGTGGATGSANLSGGATGNLASSVTLMDTDFTNEFYQTFTPGTTLNFDVSLTTNVDAGPTPDQFAVAILDNTLSNIPTTDTGGGSLLYVNIDSSAPAIVTFATTAPFAAIGTPTITTRQANVPEPSAFALLAASALSGAGFFLRRRTV